MFFVSIILFVLGMFACGIAFSLPPVQPFVFVLGILLVAAALALPIHFGGWAHDHHGD